MGIRTINVSFTDDEIEMLEERKGTQTWREFILGGN